MFFTRKHKSKIKSIETEIKKLNDKINILLLSQDDTKFDYKKYWNLDDCKNIIPLNYGRFPEGFDVIEYFKKNIINDLQFDSALDFGCGYGRLSQIFNKNIYLGIDLNKNALEKAKIDNEGYKYEETFIDPIEYPHADLCTAYTVFLHLDDITLDQILCKLLKGINKYFIISEILGREWRRDGLPKVFCREKEEYIKLMAKYGFKLIKERNEPYFRYINDPTFVDKKNKNISFLVFEKIK